MPKGCPQHPKSARTHSSDPSSIKSDASNVPDMVKDSIGKSPKSASHVAVELELTAYEIISFAWVFPADIRFVAFLSLFSIRPPLASPLSAGRLGLKDRHTGVPHNRTDGTGVADVARNIGRRRTDVVVAKADDKAVYHPSIFVVPIDRDVRRQIDELPRALRLVLSGVRSIAFGHGVSLVPITEWVTRAVASSVRQAVIGSATGAGLLKLLSFALW